MSKHRNQNKKCTVRRRSIILLVSLLSVIALSIGTTLAFIFTNTGKVENTFNPAQISCLVTEEFENNIKTNVSIKNTGNTDAYIRAAVIVT